MMTKINEKFDEFSREQLTLVPAPADKARLPNEQQQPVAGTSTELAHPVCRHRKRKRTQRPEPINSSDPDSDITNNDFPAKEIESRIHAKAKH